MPAHNRILGLLTVATLSLGVVPWSNAAPLAKPGAAKPTPLNKNAKPVKPKPTSNANANANSNSGTEWYKGTLESIFTEKNGDIINVALDTGNSSLRQLHTIQGCGLNVEQLPHLMFGFGKDKVVQIQSVNGCIGRINVMMKP